MGNQSSNGSENQSNSDLIYAQEKQVQKENIQNNENENSDRNYPYLISKSESDSLQSGRNMNFGNQTDAKFQNQMHIQSNLYKNNYDLKFNKRQLSPIHVESSSSQQNENSSIENSTDQKIDLKFLQNRISHQNQGPLKQQAFLYQPEKQNQIYQSIQDGQQLKISHNLINKNFTNIQYKPAIYTTQQQSKESLFVLTASTPSHNAVKSAPGSNIIYHDENLRKIQNQQQHHYLSPKDDRLSTIISGAEVDKSSSQNSFTNQNQQQLQFQENLCDYYQDNQQNQNQLDSSLKQEMQFDNQLSKNQRNIYQIQEQIVYDDNKYLNGGLGSFGTSDGINKHHILKSNKYSSSSFLNSSLQYTQSNPEFDKKNYNFLALKGDSISSMGSNNYMPDSQNYFQQRNNILNKKPSYINSVESIEHQQKIISDQEQQKASLPSISGQYNIISKFSSSGPYDLSDEYVDSHRQFQIVQDSKNYESLQVQQQNNLKSDQQLHQTQNNTERGEDQYQEQHKQNNLYFMNKIMYEQTQLIDKEYKKLVRNQQMLIQNQQYSEKNKNFQSEKNVESNNFQSINNNNSEKNQVQQLTNSSEPAAAKKYEIYSFQNPLSGKLSIQSFKNGYQAQSSGKQQTSAQEESKVSIPQIKSDDMIIGEQILNSVQQIPQNQYCMSTINHKTIESGSYINSVDISSNGKAYNEDADPNKDNLQGQNLDEKDLSKQTNIISKTQSKFRNIGDIVSDQKSQIQSSSMDDDKKMGVASHLKTESNSNNQASSKFSSIGTRSSITLQQNSSKTKLDNKYKVVPIVDGFKIDGINSIKQNINPSQQFNPEIYRNFQDQQYHEAIKNNIHDIVNKEKAKSESRSKSRDRNKDASQSQSGNFSQRRKQQTNDQNPQLINLENMRQQDRKIQYLINDTNQKKENEFNRIHVISTQRSSSQNQKQQLESNENSIILKNQFYQNEQYSKQEIGQKRHLEFQYISQNFQIQNEQSTNQTIDQNENQYKQKSIRQKTRKIDQDKILQDSERINIITENLNQQSSIQESSELNNEQQYRIGEQNAQFKQDMSVSCPQLLQQSQISSPQMCQQNNDYCLNTNSQNTHNNKKSDQFKLEEQTTTLQSSAAMPPHLLNSIIPGESQQSESNQLYFAQNFKQMNFYDSNMAQKFGNQNEQNQNLQINIQDQSSISQTENYNQNNPQKIIMADVIGKCEMSYQGQNQIYKNSQHQENQLSRNEKNIIYTNQYSISNSNNLKTGDNQSQNQFYNANQQNEQQSDTQNTYGNEDSQMNIQQQQSDEDLLMYSQENYNDQNYEYNNDHQDQQFQNQSYLYQNNYNQQFYPTLQNDQDVHSGAIVNQHIFYQNPNEIMNQNSFDKEIPKGFQESENNLAVSIRIDNMNQSNPYKNILQNTLGVSDATQFLMLGTLPNGPVIGQSLNGTQNENQGILKIADSTGLGSYQVFKNDEKEDSGQFYESPTLGSQQESFLLNGNRQIEKQSIDNRNQQIPQTNEQNNFESKMNRVQANQQMLKQPKHIVNRTYSFANQQNSINYQHNMSTINHESFINQNILNNQFNQEMNIQNQYQDQDQDINYIQQQFSPISRNQNDDFTNNLKNINDKTKSTLGFPENQENWNLNSQQKIDKSQGLIHAESVSIKQNYIYPDSSSNNLLNEESNKIIEEIQINRDRPIYQKNVSQFGKNYMENKEQGRIPFQSNYGKQMQQKYNRSSSLNIRNSDLNDRAENINQNFDVKTQFGLRSHSLNNNKKQDLQLTDQQPININNKPLLKTQNPISKSHLSELPQQNFFGDTSSIAPVKQIMDATSNSFSLPQNQLNVNNQSSKNSQLNQQTTGYKDFLKQDLLSVKKQVSDIQDQNFRGENSRILSYSPNDLGYLGSQLQMNTSQNKIDTGIHQYVQESLKNMKLCYPPDIIEGKYKHIPGNYGSIPLKIQSEQYSDNLRFDHENNLQNQKIIGDYEELIKQKKDQDKLVIKLKSENMKLIKEQEQYNSYIQDLQKLNDLQKEEIICLNKKNNEMKNKFANQFHQMNVELGSLQRKKMRGVEKVYSQVLQLHSSSQHLKELINLAKLDEYKCNIQMIIQYVENNVETSVLKLLQTLNLNNQQTLETKDQLDSESSQQYDQLAFQLKNLKFDTSKLQVRAQNFKKFRQSTQEMIDNLFNYQIKQKCDIISDLQKQLSFLANEKDQLNKVQTGQINEFKEQFLKLKNEKLALTDELCALKNREIPMLNSLLLEKELNLKKEFNEKENQLNSKIVKQKYQIKEFEEKEKILRSENTELRIKIEGIKVRLQDQQEQNISREYYNHQIPMPQNEQVQGNEKPYEALIAALNKDSFESYQLIQKQKEKSQILKKRFKEVQFISQKEKQELNEKIQFYKETVKNQAEVIEQLQKLSQMQKQIILQSSQSGHTMMLGASQSQKMLGERTQTQDSMKDIGSISDKNPSNSQRYKRVQSMQIKKDNFSKNIQNNQPNFSEKTKLINIVSDYAPTTSNEDANDKKQHQMIPQKYFLSQIDKSSSSIFQQHFENNQKIPIFYNHQQVYQNEQKRDQLENKYNEKSSLVLKPLTITSLSESTDNKITFQDNQNSFGSADENHNLNNRLQSYNQSTMIEQQNFKSHQNYYEEQNFNDSINQQNINNAQDNSAYIQAYYYQSQQNQLQNTLQSQFKHQQSLQISQQTKELDSDVELNKYKHKVPRNEKFKSRANSKSPQKSILSCLKTDQQVIQTLSLEETQQEQTVSQKQYSQNNQEQSYFENEILIEKNEYKGLSQVNNQIFQDLEQQLEQSNFEQLDQNDQEYINENISDNQQTVINQSANSQNENDSQTQSEVKNSMTLLQRKIFLLEKKLNSKKIGTKYSPILEKASNQIDQFNTGKTVRIKDDLNLYQDQLDSDEYRQSQMYLQESINRQQNMNIYNVQKSGNNYNGLHIQNEKSLKESTQFDGTELEKVIVLDLNTERKRVSKERNHHFISNSQESNNENPMPLQKFINLENDQNSASLRTSQLTSQYSQ